MCARRVGDKRRAVKAARIVKCLTEAAAAAVAARDER